MRLTKQIRESIMSAAMKHRFEAEDKLLKVEETKLANDLLDAQFSPDDLKLLNSLPSGWTTQVISVHAKLYGGTEHLRLDRTRNVPWDMEYGIKGDTDALAKFTRKRQALHDAKHAARSAIAGALNKVQTTQTLTRTWPEIAQFIPKDVTVADKSASLAFPIETLNKMLKLP